MKMITRNQIKNTLAAAACASALILFSGCASTTVKSTWKSPDYKAGPPQKVAVVADEERMMVREALENRFVNQLAKSGQPAFATAASFADLTAARKNKEATMEQLRANGADVILITRLVSKSAYVARAKQTHTGRYVALTTSPDSNGWETSVGSYSTSGRVPRSDDRDSLLLDTSLFDMKTGQRVWGCITEVVVKETSDRLEIADEFVAKVVEAMRKDGVIR